MSDAERGDALALSPAQRAAIEAAPVLGQAEALARAERDAEELLAAAYSSETRRAYRTDFFDFTWWCHRHGLEPMPAAADTLVLYVASSARGRELAPARNAPPDAPPREGRLAPRTIRRRLSAIRFAHRARGEVFAEGLALEAVLRGVNRTYGRPPASPPAMSVESLQELIDTIARPRGNRRRRSPFLVKRDRALLLLGFAAGLRRSELAGLDVGDVELTDRGAAISLRASKTDPARQGQVRHIGRIDSKYCPTKALERLVDQLRERGHADGPLFRSQVARRDGTYRLTPTAIYYLLAGAVRAAGLDREGLSPHSLRHGLATAAGRQGVDLVEIARAGGWQTLDTVAGYVERATGYDHTITHRLGL